MTNAVRDPWSQARLDVASTAIARLDAKICDFERRHPDIAKRVAAIRSHNWFWRAVVGARSDRVFVTDGLRPLRLACFRPVDPVREGGDAGDFHRRCLDHVAASLGLSYDELVGEYRAVEISKARVRIYQFWTSKG